VDAIYNKSVCDLTVHIDQIMDLTSGTLWQCGLTPTFRRNVFRITRWFWRQNIQPNFAILH